MLFYIKLAWRNMLRNKRRTIIASIAIGIGLASLIVGGAVSRGMAGNMVKTVTTTFLGEAQINARGYREAQEVEQTVKNLDAVMAGLQADPLVDRFAPRVVSMGMLTAPANVNAVMVVGIDPKLERFLSKMDDALREGTYFEGDGKRDIVIGSRLAEVLEVGVGDRVVLTVAKAGSGELSQEMFRICGIYHFNVREMDGGLAFVRIQMARDMLGIGEAAHQVVVKFKDIHTASRGDIGFWEQFSTDGNEAVGWGVLMPQLKVVVEMMAVMRYVMILILAAVVVFGIINTLFMSLYERMFEFAVMRAVGTRASGLRKLIIFEAAALAVISILVGVVLGTLVNLYLGTTGIDYRGIEFAGAAFNEIVYPEIALSDYILHPLFLLIFTTLVGIYPAWAAGKMKPAETMRKSL